MKKGEKKDKSRNQLAKMYCNAFFKKIKANRIQVFRVNLGNSIFNISRLQTFENA